MNFYGKILIRKIIIVLFLIISNLAGQDFVDESDPIIVDSIRITGNTTTEEHIILRELDFGIGDTISQNSILFNKERVFSLGIFNKVEMYVAKDSTINVLNIDVTESWYIYPLPFLRLRENSFKRSSYGLGVLYKNFRGRNETLWALITFGFDPTYMLYYYNPVLITGKNLTFGLSLGFTDLENRSISSEILNGQEFSYNYIHGQISFGYRINQYNMITHSSLYEYVELPEKISTLSGSNENIDRTFSMGLTYEYDNRNLKQFSNNGTFGKFDIIHKGFGINNISYNILMADVRQYNIVFGDLTTKWRGAYRGTFGSSIPFYALSLLGDDEYIRGHRFNKREGNNYLITSLEVNYPIIKELDFSLDLPLLPKNLTSARIGLYTNIFVDSGTTFNNGEALKIRSVDTGWGLGLTLLILPYNAIRFEYAFNELSRGEFILETGFSF